MSISSDSEMMPLVVVAEVREDRVSESRGISFSQAMLQKECNSSLKF